MTTPVRIALDAFGGDDCPAAEVAGAVEAARDGVHVILVGDASRLTDVLRGYPDHEGLPIRIHHAPQVITMDDSPSKAVRAKPDASMPVCFDLVRVGEADAVMSAGNSGAMLACGLFKYRRIKGIDRPAIVTSLPTAKDFVSFLDVGANVECRPINLTQFAVMGAVYARFKHKREHPRVGVLSNGTEEGKGTDLTRATHRLLDEHPSDDFTYVGYVEGDGLFSGDVDVVVTDGFTGNVALKIAEATGRLIGKWLRRAVESGPRSKLGALLMRPAFAELKSMLDPDSYGAAPLLGVGGGAFICHGKSSPQAISTSLQLAARSVSEELIPRLRDAVERNKALFEISKADDADVRAAKGVTA
jgi:glycerol-3-phosphate acyltransferase PlsX